MSKRMLATHNTSRPTDLFNVTIGTFNSVNKFKNILQVPFFYNTDFTFPKQAST